MMVWVPQQNVDKWRKGGWKIVSCVEPLNELRRKYYSGCVLMEKVQ